MHFSALWQAMHRPAVITLIGISALTTLTTENSMAPKSNKRSTAITAKSRPQKKLFWIDLAERESSGFRFILVDFVSV